MKLPAHLTAEMVLLYKEREGGKAICSDCNAACKHHTLVSVPPA